MSYNFGLYVELTPSGAGFLRQKCVRLTLLLNLSKVLLRLFVGVLFWRQKLRPFPRKAFVPVGSGSFVSRLWHVRFWGIESYLRRDMRDKYWILFFQRGQSGFAKNPYCPLRSLLNFCKRWVDSLRKNLSRSLFHPISFLFLLHARLWVEHRNFRSWRGWAVSGCACGFDFAAASGGAYYP